MTKTIPVAEAAILLAVSRQRVRELILLGRLRATKDDSGLLQVNHADAVAVAKANRKPGRPKIVRRTRDEIMRG